MSDDTPTIPQKGVSFTEPPGLLLASVNKQIDSALSAIPKDKFLVGIVDVKTTTGINAAIVARIDEHWSVVGYVGKKWGAPIEGGASVRAVW